MTIDSADDSKISNRTINTNQISNRTYDSKSNRITKLCRSLLNRTTSLCLQLPTAIYITGSQHAVKASNECVIMCNVIREIIKIALGLFVFAMVFGER